MSLSVSSGYPLGAPPSNLSYRPSPVPMMRNPGGDSYAPLPMPPLSVFPDDAMSVQQYVQLGERYFQENRFKHAILAYDMALMGDPRNHVLYNKRGVAKANIKDYLGAFADYTEAIRLKPDFYSAYINRGNIRSYIKDYPGALEDYTRAIRIAPFESVGYENRSELYSMLGMRQESLQDKAVAIHLQKMKAPAPIHQGLRQCPKRLALVMANDDYVGRDNDLHGGPANDAQAMKKVLESKGFEVVFALNQTGPQMRATVDQYMQKLAQFPGAVSFVYYSGHGGSINGNNYLIPVDYVKGADPSRFAETTVSVDYLIKHLKQVPSFFNMIVIDACRNPLFEPMLKTGSSMAVRKNWESEPAPGLSNVWIEYASRPRKPALQHGDSGLYTRYLLHYMQQPDLSLKEVSMYTSYALEQDPIAQMEDQHARTQTDLSQTEGIATSFYFTDRCSNPFRNPQTMARLQPAAYA